MKISHLNHFFFSFSPISAKLLHRTCLLNIDGTPPSQKKLSLHISQNFKFVALSCLFIRTAWPWECEIKWSGEYSQWKTEG